MQGLAGRRQGKPRTQEGAERGEWAGGSGVERRAGYGAGTAVPGPARPRCSSSPWRSRRGAAATPPAEGAAPAATLPAPARRACAHRHVPLPAPCASTPPVSSWHSDSEKPVGNVQKCLFVSLKCRYPQTCDLPDKLAVRLKFPLKIFLPSRPLLGLKGHVGY